MHRALNREGGLLVAMSDVMSSWCLGGDTAIFSEG